MKRFIVFLLILLVFAGIYNLRVLQGSVSGFFGDSSYRKGDFSDAERRYAEILNKDTPLSSEEEGLGVRGGSTLLPADTLYNLGNALYRLGEREKDDERVKLWKESVGSYTRSLSIRTDKETEENLAFVKEKLQKEEQEQKKQDEEKKKEEQKKQDEKNKTGSGTDQKQDQNGDKDNTGSGQTGDKTGDQQWKDKPQTGSGSEKEKTGTWQQSKPQSWQNWSNKWSYNPLGWQDKDSVDSKLSDSDRQEVQKYLEDLKQFAKQNGKLLNPEKWGGAGSISDQIRNFFGNDSFFQDVIPGNDEKKDW